MSSHHSTTVFKNSCLKLPVNPINRLPSPSYEHSQDISPYSTPIPHPDQCSRSGSAKKKYNDTNIHLKLTQSSPHAKLDAETQQISQSFSDFYESIPDYGDVNHLTNKEFYEKLNNLKLKQKKLCMDYVQHSEPVPKWTDAYKPASVRDPKRSPRKKSSYKPWYEGDLKHSNNGSVSECDTSTPSWASEKEFHKSKRSASPAKRTVRITNGDVHNTPDSTSTAEYLLKKDSHGKSGKDTRVSKSKKTITAAAVRNCSAKSKNSSNVSMIESMWDDYYHGPGAQNKTEILSDSEFDFLPEADMLKRPPLCTRSAPNSPLKNKHSVGWKDAGITIPKPFQMTVRDEEDHILNELLATTESPTKENDTEHKMFRANPVPIESRVPLFDKIMANQERRREIVKLNSKIALQSQVRPFSFTKREEELKEISRLFCSKSSPQLDSCSKDHSARPRAFKAKPVPKNLFSNYFYEKMREDEYYRALKKRIRAEEMLKASSLPPSMAAREREYKKALDFLLDGHYLDELECLDSSEHCKRRYHRKVPNYRLYHDRMQRQLEDLKNNFITTSPRPYQLTSSKRAEKRAREHLSVCTRSREGSDNSRARSALELQSINRSNLAAILRIEAAKKRLEADMQHKLDEERRKNETRWRAKITRKRSAWQTLKYDHEEELALRLQLRRDEERMRREEHHHQMELMLGRVQQMPYLFERHSQFPSTERSRRELAKEIYSQLEENVQKEINEEEIAEMLEENMHKLAELEEKNKKEEREDEIKEEDTIQTNSDDHLKEEN